MTDAPAPTGAAFPLPHPANAALPPAGSGEPTAVASVTAASNEASSPTTGTIWSVAFWKGAGERGIKTFAQSALAAALIGVTGNTIGITDINWEQVGSIGALATVLSLLTSIGNSSFTAGK